MLDVRNDSPKGPPSYPRGALARQGGRRAVPGLSPSRLLPPSSRLWRTKWCDGGSRSANRKWPSGKLCGLSVSARDCLLRRRGGSAFAVANGAASGKRQKSGGRYHPVAVSITQYHQKKIKNGTEWKNSPAPARGRGQLIRRLRDADGGRRLADWLGIADGLHAVGVDGRPSV
jgi:hypothetical protein